MMDHQRGASSGNEPNAAVGGPVFIVGTMRSGSTLLRLILDSHPNIAIAPETAFTDALAAVRDNPP